MDHDVRKLKWQNQQLRQQCGKQGQTIFNLRCQLAEVHTLISKGDRGWTRRIQDQYDQLFEMHQRDLKEIERLRGILKGER